MALSVKAFIYGANKQDWNKPNGVVFGFPTQGIVIRQLSPAETYSGVSCPTAVQLMPYGPSPIQPVYYTDTAAATLITNANA